MENKKEIFWLLQLCQTIFQREVEVCRDECNKEHVQRFVECVITYTRVHTEAFRTLCGADNYIAAHHFYRLISDCALRVYAVTLFKGKELEKCIDNFFKGKEPKDYPTYKGRKLGTKYLLDLIKQENVYGEIISAFQKEGNRSVHFSDFYNTNLVVTDEDRKDMIGWFTSLLVFLGGLLSRLSRL